MLADCDAEPRAYAALARSKAARFVSNLVTGKIWALARGEGFFSTQTGRSVTCSWLDALKFKRRLRANNPMLDLEETVMPLPPILSPPKTRCCHTLLTSHSH